MIGIAIAIAALVVGFKNADTITDVIDNLRDKFNELDGALKPLAAALAVSAFLNPTTKAAIAIAIPIITAAAVPAAAPVTAFINPPTELFLNPVQLDRRCCTGL